jgi:beta-lactamase superfamily II metal-dependent hydrolase
MAQLTVDILDVGQGDGMFINFPNGKTMLVDLGSTRNKDLVNHDAFKYFKDHTKYAKQNQDLDYLVLTHGDKDHYNLIVDFVNTFKPRIRNVIHGGEAGEYTVPVSEHSAQSKNLVDWLANKMQSDHGITVNRVTGAQKFPMGIGPGEDSVKEFGAEVYILCMGLQAASSEPAYIKNTKSVVLQLRYPPNRSAGEQSVILLAGDATRDTENFITTTYQTVGNLTPGLLRCDVLKLGHHGSHRTSNTAQWLSTVNPHYVFVSSDRNGALDDVQKPTGHRLPQYLTLDLVEKYCPRLYKDTPQHTYVSAFDPADYAGYNCKPDDPGKPLTGPTIPAQWFQHNDTRGIFSTLATIGPGEGDADHGVQYQIVAQDNGKLDVLATADFTTFNPANGSLA